MKAKPSKSARKRENLALQELGERLISLSTEQLSTIDLNERLHEAVMQARSMKAHGALRRQKQLIGKLMRDIDPAPIREALDAFGRKDRQEKRLFAAAEKWRSRILSDDPAALDAFRAHVGHDCDDLAGMVKAWHGAAGDRDRKTAGRGAFREVLRILTDKVQNEAGCS